MKPLLKLHPQFKIPEPYRAWCHPCNQGFMSIEELQAHDREKINAHRGQA
jgi:hypothetical protein